MKRFGYILTLFVLSTLTSCIVVDRAPAPGPPGFDGRAYYRVDFDRNPPYSYWDNNPAIPFNPILGDFYRTNPGIYEFEYFVNPRDYWYGTYEVWINRGGPGGPNGEPGLNGLDTYLTMVCDPNGFYEHRTQWRMDVNEPLVIEKNEGELNFKITIQKGNVDTRPAQVPKYKQN